MLIAYTSLPYPQGLALGRLPVLTPQVVPDNQPQVQHIEHNHRIPEDGRKTPGRQEWSMPHRMNAVPSSTGA